MRQFTDLERSMKTTESMSCKSEDEERRKNDEENETERETNIEHSFVIVVLNQRVQSFIALVCSTT